MIYNYITTNRALIMTNKSNSPRHNMIRRVETKDDGRILIYYTFESFDDLSDTNKQTAETLDNQKSSEERAE